MFTQSLLLCGLAAANPLELVRRQAATVTVTVTPSTTTSVNLFPTSPEIYPGNTATGLPAGLALTNPVNGYGLPNATRSYVAPNPIVTNELIPNATDSSFNVAQNWGNLSPYQASPGFGVEEYALPAQCYVKQVHILQRHGARYPTADASTATLAASLRNASSAVFTGELAFLNNFTYKLGAEILTPLGRQQLFDAGVQANYAYRYLYNTSAPKIVARTTSQDRILKSAEYWLAGFFGFEWSNYANLEVIIENTGFNNSLASYDTCTNNNLAKDETAGTVMSAWERIYLANALTRLQANSRGFNWTIPLVYAAQQMCPYETVALGYSAFCSLFNQAEWQGFEYSVDISFEQGGGLGSAQGRAGGIGYVDELIARITNTPLNSTVEGVNKTLDLNSTFFPLGQSIYLDVSHDTDLSYTLAALGLSQFGAVLPSTGPPANQQFIASHLVPFGGRLTTEVITCSTPIGNNHLPMSNTNGNTNTSAQAGGGNTTYIHLLANQRTIPFGQSFSVCGNRVDGWCELSNFLAAEANRTTLAEYNYACFGNYTVTSANITDGRPLSKRASLPYEVYDQLAADYYQ